MNEFLAYVSQFGHLTLQQQALLAQQATRVTLRKGDTVGAQQVGFVETGVLRVCSATEAGDELTRYFIEEGHPILCVPQPAAESAASHFVQAVTECQLLLFTAHQWQHFAQLIPGWEVIEHKIRAQAMQQKLHRVLPLVTQDAAARYQSFLITYPQLANRVPLTYLASYLGMKPSSLSRIRKHIR